VSFGRHPEKPGTVHPAGLPRRHEELKIAVRRLMARWPRAGCQNNSRQWVFAGWSPTSWEQQSRLTTPVHASLSSLSHDRALPVTNSCGLHWRPGPNLKNVKSLPRQSPLRVAPRARQCPETPSDDSRLIKNDPEWACNGHQTIFW